MMGVFFCRLAHQDEKYGRYAHVAQLVEHVLGKDEVISSILIMGSRHILFNCSTNRNNDNPATQAGD